MGFISYAPWVFLFLVGLVCFPPFFEFINCRTESSKLLAPHNFWFCILAMGGDLKREELSVANVRRKL